MDVILLLTFGVVLLCLGVFTFSEVRSVVPQKSLQWPLGRLPRVGLRRRPERSC